MQLRRQAETQMQKRRSNLIRASKEAKLPRSNHDVKKGRGFVIVVAMLAVFLFATHLSGSLLYFYGIVEPAMKNIKDSESSPEPEDQRDTCFGGCPINQSSARNQILNFPNNTNEFILGPTKKRRTFLHDSAGEKRTFLITETDENDGGDNEPRRWCTNKEKEGQSQMQTTHRIPAGQEEKGERKRGARELIRPSVATSLGPQS